jgi:integrase
MPFAEVPAFMDRLRKADSLSAKALTFTILTACRTGEAIGARWGEIDFDLRLWTIPATRMKAKRPHRVPLSSAALAIVAKLAEVKMNDFVFPGARADRHLSNMALLELLKGMDVDATTHGFRSAFRDWVSEATTFSGDIAEAALAHIVRDATEAAYRRGDLFDKRRAMMESWARFCGGQTNE